MRIMFWFILIILCISTGFWLMLFSGRLKKSAVAGSEEDTPFVFSDDKPFLFSRMVENQDLKEAEKNRPEIKSAERLSGWVMKDEGRASERADGHFYYNREAIEESPSKPEFEKGNTADVTRELVSVVMKMPGYAKFRLLREKADNQTSLPARYNPGTITQQVVEMIMNLTPEERCRLLAECKTRKGIFRRNFARKNYVTPIYFAVKGILQNEFTKNISKGGVFIETLKTMDLKFLPGDPIIMNFEHPGDRNNVKVQGKIIRVSSRAIGVRFDEPFQNMN